MGAIVDISFAFFRQSCANCEYLRSAALVSGLARTSAFYIFLLPLSVGKWLSQNSCISSTIGPSFRLDSFLHPSAMGRAGTTSRVSTIYRLSPVCNLTPWDSKRSTSERDASGLRSPLSRLTTPDSDGYYSPLLGDQLPSASARTPPRPPTPGPSGHTRRVSRGESSVTRGRSIGTSSGPHRGMSHVTGHLLLCITTYPPTISRPFGISVSHQLREEPSSSFP